MHLTGVWFSRFCVGERSVSRSARRAGGVRSCSASWRGGKVDSQHPVAPGLVWREGRIKTGDATRSGVSKPLLVQRAVCAQKRLAACYTGVSRASWSLYGLMLTLTGPRRTLPECQTTDNRIIQLIFHKTHFILLIDQ